ncbi:hypothetical protein K435DRAFT_966125 [Dendrothele bispora CBS 962.96]|uniref:Uncharacterized protein n=1 Tax=Dendrothele bispora (strain CBS 962.96) TaxID=1314807 RepID=A0A4S8M1S3_DENBC|nr:hypothetical protein K435DRAFT_966125 [Dendrothele bispora CBS 962.96]
MASTSDCSSQSFLTSQDATGILISFIQETVGGLLCGIECVLVASVYLLLSRNGLFNSASKCVLLAMSILMLLGSIMEIVTKVGIDAEQLKALSNPEYNPLPNLIKWEKVTMFFSRFSYMLGDLIVVWRAWILFPGKSPAKCALVVCIMVILGSFISNLFFAYKDLANFEIDPSPGPRLILPAALLFTNVIATLLIAYKAWHYRKFIKDNAGILTRKGQVEQVLILLVESGILYIALWILTLLSDINNELDDTTGAYLDTVLPHLTLIYPSVIILLSQLKKTQCDTILQGEDSSQSMQFAVAPASNSSRLMQAASFESRAGIRPGMIGHSIRHGQVNNLDIESNTNSVEEIAGNKSGAEGKAEGVLGI